MSKYQLLINGEMVDGDLTMDVLNPATEEKVADCPRASVEQLNSAVEAAKDAFPVGVRPASMIGRVLSSR